MSDNLRLIPAGSPVAKGLDQFLSRFLLGGWVVTTESGEKPVHVHIMTAGETRDIHVFLTEKELSNIHTAQDMTGLLDTELSRQ